MDVQLLASFCYRETEVFETHWYGPGHNYKQFNFMRELASYAKEKTSTLLSRYLNF